MPPPSMGNADTIGSILIDHFDPLEPLELVKRYQPSQNINNVRLPSEDAFQANKSTGSFPNDRTIVELVVNAQKSEVPATSDLFNEHICITALLHGWDQTRARYDLSSRWDKYQAIDESFVSVKDFASRLSMGLLHKIWQFREHPEWYTEAVKCMVPSWIWPVGSQDTLAVGNIVNSMPWPGIRLEMIKDPDAWVADELFWSSHIQHWRFAWPHDLSDTVEYSPNSEMYMFVPEFRKRMHDIRYWTYESEFFEKLPNLAGKVSKFEPQLAVHRLHNRTVQHEYVFRRAARNNDLYTALQAYYDSLEKLEEIQNGQNPISKDRERQISFTDRRMHQ